MSTNVTLHAGHDVAYFTSGQGRGGCAGAMSYYTAAGEPPGQWAGKAAAALGLAGQVDPKVIERLYQENTDPGGELLVKRRQSKKADEREQGAVTAYLAAHPYASAVELAEVRAAGRGKDPHTVPYFDLTVSAVKSVSVLHASYRVSARQAREHGDQDQAAALDAKADQLADRGMETRLSALGYAMVPRADGNGAEVGGVSQEIMDLFSSRAVAVTGELKRLAQEYAGKHGKPPSRRTLWLLHQQAGQNTRRTTSQARRTIAGQTGAAEPTGAQRLAAWEAQTVHREVRVLSAAIGALAAAPGQRSRGRQS